MTRMRALLEKELLDLRRNPSTLLPVLLVTVLSFVLPFLVIVVIPGVSGHALGDDADLARISAAAGGGEGLSPNARVQLFLLQQFLMLFLLTPITGAMALAAHSVVGEKQARTLEPLLATPITTVELLVAKVLGAAIPTVAISAIGLALYCAAVPFAVEPGVMGALLGGRTLVLVLLVGPTAALVSLQAAIVISSRVNDARTAQQFGVLIIVPLMAVLIAQFSGALWLSATALALVALGLLGVWIVLLVVSAAVFNREAILTRWK